MLRCKIENKNDEAYFDISDGAVFTENYNETLDSGTILLQQLSSKIDIEPYDVVVIDDTNNDIKINSRRMCVDTYTCTQTSLNPPIYKYEISLFSETKILEGILLPNLSITKLLNGTIRTVWDYLSLYLDLYGPKKKVGVNYLSALIYGHNIKDSTELASVKFNIQCPEMQWNHPTLREVINDLMMVADCIAVLNNNTINYLCISDIGSEVSNTQKEGINYIQETQSAEDYVSELKMNLVNVANNSELNNRDYTKVVEKIGFRNDESYLLTTENMLLQTSFPIWKIFSCKIIFDEQCELVVNNQDTGQNETFTYDSFYCDLTQYILEHADWLTRDVLYGQWGGSLSTQYRNTCLYYIRGAKNVFNFNEKVENDYLFIHSTDSVWAMIIQVLAYTFSNEMVDELNEQAGYTKYTFISIRLPNVTYKDAEFELQYEAIDECVFMASKTPFKTHKRQVVDNQTNSYIDITKQGVLEYMKANRLGNEINLVNARYYANESLIPALSEKINDKIIFKKEISVYNNYVNVNYQTVANYVLRNYFTGVKSKLRSWRVVSGNEAFVRDDIFKFYINNNIETYTENDYLIPVYNSIDNYLNNFLYCAIQLNDKNGYIIPQATQYAGVSYNTNGIMVEFTKHKISNKAVIFTIRMTDNYYVGNYVSNYDGDNHRVEQKGVRYADSDGEIEGGVICFYNGYEGDSFGNSYADKGLKPLANIGMTRNGTDGLTLNSQDLVAKIPFVLHKDNKEIMQISIQFEWNDEANDIFLGKV